MMSEVLKKRSLILESAETPDTRTNWPMIEITVLADLSKADSALLVVFNRLLKEFYDSTMKARTLKQFVDDFAPVLFGCLHGGDLFPKTVDDARARLVELVISKDFRRILRKKDELARLFVYSLLIGKVAEELPPQLLPASVE